MKPAADEFEEIARRLKELEAEKVASPLPLDDLPSDVEPIALNKEWPTTDKEWSTVAEYWDKVRELQRQKDDVLTVMPNGEIKRHDGSTVMSIYGDPFWDALVRNGVIKIVEA